VLIGETVHCHAMAMDAPLPGTGGAADEARLIAAVLVPQERARAQRLRSACHARHWSRVRVRLRQLLGERCGCDPCRVRFLIGSHGKPSLAHDKPSLAQGHWHFNVSHAGTQALIAISARFALGVDIERISERRDAAALGQAVFSEAERRAFAQVPEPERAELFTRVWVRKEALVKATGTGIGFGLARVHVGCAGQPLLRIDGRPAPRWRLSDLAAAPGYRAALCRGSAA